MIDNSRSRVEKNELRIICPLCNQIPYIIILPNNNSFLYVNCQRSKNINFVANYLKIVLSPKKKLCQNYCQKQLLYNNNLSIYYCIMLKTFININ